MEDRKDQKFSKVFQNKKNESKPLSDISLTESIHNIEIINEKIN